MLRANSSPTTSQPADQREADGLSEKSPKATERGHSGRTLAWHKANLDGFQAPYLGLPKVRPKEFPKQIQLHTR